MATDEELMEKVRRDRREKVRDIEVIDVGDEPWEVGISVIRVAQLDRNTVQSLQLNDGELKDLRDKIDAKLGTQAVILTAPEVEEAIMCLNFYIDRANTFNARAAVKVRERMEQLLKAQS
jgi:hypothetical protein